MSKLIQYETPVYKKNNMLNVGKAGEHFVCTDLILKGYNTFLADQGLSYDVIVETNEGLKSIQVKSSLNKVNYQKTKNAYRYKLTRTSGFNQNNQYRFSIRQGNKNNVRRINPKIIDYIGFVALDKMKACYIPVKQLINKEGDIVCGIDLRFKDEYNLKTEYSDDYLKYHKPKHKDKPIPRFFEDFEYL